MSVAKIVYTLSIPVVVMSIIATGMIAKDQGHAAAMAEVDAIVQPIGWEKIRKTKEVCEAKWKTTCVITGGYMPKTDVQP